MTPYAAQCQSSTRVGVRLALRSLVEFPGSFYFRPAAARRVLKPNGGAESPAEWG
jgi:hypothetical protein